jgi:hypothetical protein
VRVEPAQAGESITCACGKKLIVPTLRGLRQLENAPPDESQSRRSAGRAWSPIRGALFSSGLVVLVGSLLFLGYTYLQFSQASEFTTDRTPDINVMEGAQIEGMDLLQSLEAFYSMREEGLGEAVEPFWITAQKIVSEKRNLMIAAVGAAVAGLVAMIASLVIPAPSVR